MDKNVITLLKTQAFIDGAWVGEPRMPVIDKATGEEIARVPDLGAAETNAAIEAGAPGVSRLVEAARQGALARSCAAGTSSSSSTPTSWRCC